MSRKELPGACKQNILLNYPTWQLVDAPKLHPPYHTKTGVYSVYSLYLVVIEEERGVIYCKHIPERDIATALTE